MQRVQVVHASRHGATRGIADRIVEVLRERGFDVAIEDAATKPDPSGFDAYVIGSGVYMGSWLKEAVEHLERNAPVLSTRPVWLFSSGPLPGSTRNQESLDGTEAALGPEHGPGSAGRQRIEALMAEISVREHRVFLGAYDPNDPARSLPERVIRMLPGSKGILPEGDFRDWEAIESWARGIASELEAPVPVG